MPHSHNYASTPTHASTYSPTHSGTTVLRFLLIMCAGVWFGSSQTCLVQTPRTTTGQLWHMPQMCSWLTSSCWNIQTWWQGSLLPWIIASHSMSQCNLINGTCLSQSVSVLLVHVLIMSPGKPPYFSLIPRPFPPPVFDCLQYVNTEGEGLTELVR